MEFVVEVRIETPAWRKAWPSLVKETRDLLRLASESPDLAKKSRHGRVPPSLKLQRTGKPGHDGNSGTFEVTAVFSDDARLHKLNAQFRGKDKPTNVLSFPDGEDRPGGGIALSFETISAEAKSQGKPFINHAKHMILHGFLHLHGYDHVKPRAARLMEGLEIAMLARMGIPNPYLIEKPRA